MRQVHPQLLVRVSIHFYNLSRKEIGSFIKNHENIYIWPTMIIFLPSEIIRDALHEIFKWNCIETA